MQEEAELKDATSKDAARGKDEVALEMMKFIAMTTGYGKGATGTGYGAKGARSAEEYADSLLGLFEKCRDVVEKKKKN
jgi:hypothetical protein